MPGQSRFSVAAQFRAIDQMTKPIGRMQRQINKFVKLSGRQVDNLNKKLKDFSLGTVSKASTVAVGGLTIALGDGARRAIEFEQTLVSATAKFPGGIKKGTKEFEELRRVARETGLDVGVLAQQSAEGLDFLAMAGFNAKQAMSSLLPIMDLQVIAQTDLGTATDIATDSLGAFNLMTKDSVQLNKNLIRINDVLAKTITTSNTNLEDLFETIQEGAPVATAGGASLETFATFAGILANAGIKGSKAGTTLKNIFVSLSAQTPKATKALKSLGVVTQDAQGNLRDVVDIFADINKGIQREKLGTAETAAVLQKIFGRIPIAGVNILLKAGADNLRKYRKELEGATGASRAMAEQIRGTLKQDINKLLASFESLQITIINLNQGAANGLIMKIRDIVREIDIFIQQNKELVRGIASDFIDAALGMIKVIGLVIAVFTILRIKTLAYQGTIIALGAVLFIFSKALLVVKGILIALKVAQTAWNIAMFLSPVGAVVAAIGGLVIAGALLLEFWDPISAFFVSMWDTIGNAFSTGIDFVMSIINPFIQTISGISGLFEKFGIAFGADAASKKEPTGSDSTGPQVLTSAAVTNRSIEEQVDRQIAEILISPEGVNAEIKRDIESPRVKLRLAQSGGA